jgi:hypothetical protein
VTSIGRFLQSVIGKCITGFLRSCFIIFISQKVTNHTILFVFVVLLFHTLTLIYILKCKLFILLCDDFIYAMLLISIRLDPILSSCMIIRNIHTCILQKFLNLFKFSSWNYSLALLSLAKNLFNVLFCFVCCITLH